MKRYFYIFLIALGLTCISKNNFGQSVDTNKFDIKNFESKKIDHQLIFTTEDGATVVQTEFNHVFTEKIQASNSNFILYKSYFKKSGNLQSVGKMFSGFNVGIWSEYKENGELLRQINWDANYSFSIYDLATKLKKDIGIDILHANQGFNINRGIEQSYYQVFVGPICKCNMRVVMIDGKTGKTISDSIVPFRGSATD